MRPIYRSLSLSLLFLSLLPASARAEFVCNRDNGSYLVETKANTVIFTIVNASGVEDAHGELACEGPNEAAFLCRGKVREQDDGWHFRGPARPAEVLIPESAMQGAGAGTFRINDELIRCIERDKL